MTTAREIYEKSLMLLGEKEGAEPADAERRAVKLINLLLAEVVDLDSALRGEALSLQAPLYQIQSLEDRIACVETVSEGLMPLALAAFLIHEEDPARAGFFYQLYSRRAEELKLRCRRGRRHKIKRAY